MPMILVYFASGGCVDDVVNNWTNYQFTSWIVYSWIAQECVGLSKELFLMCTSD